MILDKEEKCFNKAILMVHSGLVKLTEEMDIFQLTDLIIKLEEEKKLKEEKSDSKIEYLDEIIDITDVGMKETVDISVSGDNLFYCNNILTKNSFGLPATADFMVALISNEELQELNQILVKQLKNRYNDPNINKRFVIGVDKSKMKLYDVEQNAQDDIIDEPVMNNTKFIEQDEDRSKGKKLKNKFKGFK